MLKLASVVHVTRHATKRMQQRCISPADVTVVLMYGDRSTAVGGRVVAISVSRAATQELVADGVITADQAKRLGNVSILVDDGAPTLISALWRNSNRGRRYHRRAA